MEAQIEPAIFCKSSEPIGPELVPLQKQGGHGFLGEGSSPGIDSVSVDAVVITMADESDD
jgi:hypothetical protein